MCEISSACRAKTCALTVSILLVVSSSIFRPSVASLATEPATRPAAAHRLSEVSE